MAKGTQKITDEGRLAGDRIKRAMQLATDGPINQAELARRMHILSSTLGNYIQGTRRVGMSMAKRIAKATGVPAAFIMGLVDERDMELLQQPESVRAAMLEFVHNLGTMTFPQLRGPPLPPSPPPPRRRPLR